MSCTSVVCSRAGPRCESANETPSNVLDRLPLWQLDIVELTGHNLESRGREEVNRLLRAGWRLLHIYTLKYEEDGVWRDWPMAVLGRLKNGQPECPSGSIGRASIEERWKCMRRDPSSEW
jgi:hypothetical protein